MDIPDGILTLLDFLTNRTSRWMIIWKWRMRIRTVLWSAHLIPRGRKS